MDNLKMQLSFLFLFNPILSNSQLQQFLCVTIKTFSRNDHLNFYLISSNIEDQIMNPQCSFQQREELILKTFTHSTRIFSTFCKPLSTSVQYGQSQSSIRRQSMKWFVREWWLTFEHRWIIVGVSAIPHRAVISVTGMRSPRFKIDQKGAMFSPPRYRAVLTYHVYHVFDSSYSVYV